MAITLNGITIAQPSANGGVKEELNQIFHQRMLVNGRLVRRFFGIKKQAALSWDALIPSDYQTLINLFTSGSAIVYANPNSGYGTFTFTGLPMHAEDVYLPGATLLRKLTVQIQEV